VQGLQIFERHAAQRAHTNLHSPRRDRPPTPAPTHHPVPTHCGVRAYLGIPAQQQLSVSLYAREGLLFIIVVGVLFFFAAPFLAKRAPEDEEEEESFKTRF
jgi:hypothetical protein